MSEESTTPGLVHVYTGNGKGKTTAALGLAVRAMGCDKKVYMIQFMKGQTEYGELITAERSPLLTIRQFGRPGFVNKEKPADEDVQMAQEALQHAREISFSGEYDVVILDEVNVATDYGLITVDDVLEVIENKHPAVELVLTGRYAPQRIIDTADYVTEMKEIKHPYTRGVTSRRGIEL